jgi:hypothetical protein
MNLPITTFQLALAKDQSIALSRQLKKQRWKRKLLSAVIIAEKGPRCKVLVGELNYSRISQTRPTISPCTNQVPTNEASSADMATVVDVVMVCSNQNSTCISFYHPLTARVLAPLLLVSNLDKAVCFLSKDSSMEVDWKQGSMPSMARN